jgi:hypothetical protein
MRSPELARAVPEIEKEIRALLEEFDGPADPDVERARLAQA